MDGQKPGNGMRCDNPNCLNGIEDRVKKSKPRTIAEELANRLELVKSNPDELPIILALCKAMFKKNKEFFEDSFKKDLVLNGALKETLSLLRGGHDDEELFNALADMSASILGGIYLVEMLETFAQSET